MKMQITDGTFKTIEHQQVIEAWVNTCRALPNLISAVKACSDIMVSDYHGNGPHDTFGSKHYMSSCYQPGSKQHPPSTVRCTTSSPRKATKASAGVQRCPAATSPHPNIRKLLQLQITWKFTWMGQGGISLSSFPRLQVDDVAPTAISNDPIEQVDAFAQSAARGGTDIQGIVQGTGLQFRFSQETFADILKDVYFEEDWPPIMACPLITKIANHLFEGNLDIYQFALQRLLASCALPMHGITLAKATQNWHIAEHKQTSAAMQTFACFSAWQILMVNDPPWSAGWSGKA